MTSSANGTGKKPGRSGKSTGIIGWIAEGYPLFRIGAVVILMVFALSVLLMKWTFEDRVLGFVPGGFSPRTYFALYPMKYADEEGTKILRSRVGETVAGVLVRDGAAKDRLIHRIEAMAAGKLEDLPLSTDLAELLKSDDPESRKQILREAARVAEVFLEGSAMEGYGLAPSPELIWREIEKLSLPMDKNNIIYQILDELLPPLTRVDEDLTRTLRSEMAESLQPLERTVAPGDILVEKGQVITPQVAGILKMQGYSEITFPWKQIFFALVAIPFWPLWIRLRTGRPSAGSRKVHPWLYISFIVGLSWLLEYVSSTFSAEGMGSLFLTGCAYLTLPSGLALQVVLGGSLLGAVVVTGLSALHVVIVSSMGIVSALAGYFLLKEIHSRGHLWSHLLLLGLLQALVGIFVRWAFDLTLFPNTFLYLLGGNVVWSTLVIAILPLLENTFDVISPLRLMELSHPSNPLLKKLQIEAPGTYHHSLMLGTLAEVVADRLGMNSKLIKAGAYFHDIGKLRRPQFFVENQLGSENIHDEIKPTLSGLVITSHVREGLELAEEYHLPDLIRQFIAEHHGTTCLSYFYRKALNEGHEVPREQFCYPGPRPQSRETGLLMLVDSIEAAVRAEMRSTTTVPDLKKTIDGVIEAKVAEGQLDNIDFTLRDLAVIGETLLTSFQSMYHTRKVKELKEISKDTPDKDTPKTETREDDGIEASIASRQ